MNGPHCCPICNNISIKTTPTLKQYSVIAKGEDGDRDIGGLATFICENGPIFFLCHKDLGLDTSAYQVAV